MQKGYGAAKQSDDVGYRWYGPIVYQKITGRRKIADMKNS